MHNDKIDHMDLGKQEVSPGASHSVVSRHYQAFISSGEHFRSVWEEEQGIAFLDREWSEPATWEAPYLEIQGCYNFYVQSKSHLQCGEFNGIPSRARCRVGAVQCVRPDETVHTAGVGQTRILQVSFSARYLNEYLDRNFAMPAGIDLATRQFDDLGLSFLARGHHEATDNGLPCGRLYFDEIREAVLNRIVDVFNVGRKRHLERHETLVPARVRNIVDYVEQNLHRHLRLVELAAVAGVSRAHFARSFRNAIGMSPHGFVVHRRLNRAAHLLHKRNLPIHEIANRCGFADAAHLTRCFKSRFGVPPSRLPK
jgi:AraC-like DNA-binding protein